MCNSDFRTLFFISAARERCYKQIAASVAKYREIKKNINEGLNFYVTLQVCLHFHFFTICIEHRNADVSSRMSIDSLIILVYRKQSAK